MGAHHDLARNIRTHLFLLCPNNSGSTFLIRAIGLCRQVWGLNREGQHVFGFAGPSPSPGSLNRPLLWGAYEDALQTLEDDASYDWEKIRRAWYFQASAASENATVFATKTPPFLTIPHLLHREFRNVKFIFMARNPYAMAEGVIRRYRTRITDEAELCDLCARHIITCFERQRRNVAAYAANSVGFTYERLCAHPDQATRLLQRLSPELVDLDLEQRISVKGMYNSPLTNFNQAQIARLSQTSLGRLRERLSERQDLFEYFGYTLAPENVDRDGLDWTYGA